MAASSSRSRSGRLLLTAKKNGEEPTLQMGMGASPPSPCLTMFVPTYISSSPLFSMPRESFSPLDSSTISASMPYFAAHAAKTSFCTLPLFMPTRFPLKEA